MSGIVIVKLGGSAISVKTSDKSMSCTPRLDIIHRALDALAKYRQPLILLHGGGSFAHPFINTLMKKNRFKRDLPIVSEVELNLDQLTRIIGVGLLLRNRPFVPIRPMSFLTLKDGDVGAHFLAPITSSLSSGMIPLIHGDLVVDERGGFGVVSADRIASLLGEEIELARVLFGCDVDGIYDGDPKRKPGAKLIPTVNRKISRKILRGTSSMHGDVTGGMNGKVREAVRLAKNGVESCIFNLNDPRNLQRLLGGSDGIGTRFLAWKG